MRFTLTIDCDNDALTREVTDAPGGPYRSEVCTLELFRLLNHARESIRNEKTSGALVDSNGNTVGRFGFDREEGN